MPGLGASDEAAIRNLRDRLVRAILAGDGASYADSYAPEGIVVHPETPWVRGSGAFKSTTRDGKVAEGESKAGTAVWGEAVTHSWESLGPGEQRIIITELKGGARR